jgi:hypothetical protein
VTKAGLVQHQHAVGLQAQRSEAGLEGAVAVAIPVIQSFGAAFMAASAILSSVIRSSVLWVGFAITP